jgi:hypothetical protein
MTKFGSDLFVLQATRHQLQDFVFAWRQRLDRLTVLTLADWAHSRSQAVHRERFLKPLIARLLCGMPSPDRASGLSSWELLDLGKQDRTAKAEMARQRAKPNKQQQEIAYEQ